MKYFILILMSLLWSGAFAQLDRADNTHKGSKYIGRGTHDRGQGTKSMGNNRHIGKGVSIGNDSKTLMGIKLDEISLDRKENDKIDMTPDQQFMTRHVKIQPEYLKKEEGRKTNPAFKKPQDLGTYRIDSKYIIISWRDAQAIDGDRVNIIVNNTVVAHNVTLLAGYRSLKVKLKKGFTQVEFRALNQGRSGPNTAEFKVEDDSGQTVTHGLWNLATGVKASLLVVKE